MGQATYTEQFFPVFVNLWPDTQFLFPPPTCSRTIPNMHVQLYSKVDSSSEAYGGGGEGLDITYYRMAPSLLLPQGAYAMSPLPQGWEIYLLIFYSNRVWLLSVPALTVIFKCPQETKSGYLPSFCYFYSEVQTGGSL